MNLQLMDVTLRESNYVPNTPLTLDYAKQVIEGLSRSNIDFIEIGYISSEAKKEYLPSYSPVKYIEALGESVVRGSNTKLVLMLHPHQYTDDLMERMTQKCVGLVRLCIPLANVDFSLPLIKKLKRNNIIVSANLIRASSASSNEIVDFTEKVEEAGADYMYLADSNGAMLPNQISELYSLLHNKFKIRLGFHPHNNLHVASANALEAINAGASVIDGSLYGFGKGLANLSLESFVAVINRLDHKKRDLRNLIETSNKAYQHFIKPGVENLFMVKQKGILTGYCNVNLDIVEKAEMISKQQNIHSIDLLLKMFDSGQSSLNLNYLQEFVF